MVSDLIDRKTVFDVIDKCILEKLEDDTVEIKEPLKLITKIYRIPSAQPERKTGEWIYKYLPAKVGSKNLVEVIMCSKCRYVVQTHPSNFCPRCGADMRGESDETICD